MPKDQMNTGRYTIDRMRERSGILEPQEQLNPYRNYFTESVNPELDLELAKSPGVKDAKALIQAVQTLWKRATGEATQAVDRLSILAESVMLAPRAGESFTFELLSK